MSQLTANPASQTIAGPAPAGAGAPDATASPQTRGSAIYEGTVYHQRHKPFTHGFSYRIFLPLFDLDELPELLDPIPLWTARSAPRFSPARFRRSDYLPSSPASLSLADAARDLVAEHSGSRPGGPVKLLANPRYWGVGMNPVAFYYLYGSGPGAGVEAMIAEVTNTPWGERRTYVLDVEPGADDAPGLSGSFDKALHVSPFMPMEQSYRWSANEPGRRLAVSLSNFEGEELVFEAGVSLQRREIDRDRMLRLLFSYPPMTISTLGRIYWQALKLKLKGAPYFRNPTPTKERPS